MTRAIYVYIVTKGAEIVAPFTVKHEAVSWLQKLPSLVDMSVQCWRYGELRHNKPAVDWVVGK